MHSRPRGSPTRFRPPDLTHQQISDALVYAAIDAGVMIEIRKPVTRQAPTIDVPGIFAFVGRGTEGARWAARAADLGRRSDPGDDLTPEKHLGGRTDNLPLAGRSRSGERGEAYFGTGSGCTSAACVPT